MSESRSDSLLSGRKRLLLNIFLGISSLALISTGGYLLYKKKTRCSKPKTLNEFLKKHQSTQTIEDSSDDEPHCTC